MASLQSPMMAVAMVAIEPQQRVLKALHYIAPSSVFAYFLIATTISACTIQHLKGCTTGPRKVLVSLLSLVVISFLVESCILLTDTAFYAARYSSTDTNVSTVPRIYEPRRQGSHIMFADRKMIRFMHYSHCSSGQLLLRAL